MQLVRKVNTVEADGGTMSTFLVGTFPLTLQLLWSKVGGAAGRLLVSWTPPGIDNPLLSIHLRYPCAPTSTGIAPSLTPPLHHIPTPQGSTINLTAHWEKKRQTQSVPNPGCARRRWQEKALKTPLQWPLHCSFCSFLQLSVLPNATWITRTAHVTPQDFTRLQRATAPFSLPALKLS